MPKQRTPTIGPVSQQEAQMGDMLYEIQAMANQLPIAAITQLTKPERIKALADLVVDPRRYPKIAEALEWVKVRNPRVMAHNQYIDVAPLKNAAGSSSESDFLDNVLTKLMGITAPGRRPSKMTLDPMLEQMDPAEIVNTISHEAMHGAQRLIRGKKGMANEYLSQLDDFGYAAMPLEKEARKAGVKRSGEYASEKLGLRKPRK